MATKNSLVKITSTTVSSNVASVTLTGIDSTYNVYLLTFSNVTVDVDNQSLILNFTTSGSADTTANYQVHTMSIRDAGDANRTQSTATYATICENLGLGSNEIANGNILIFQAADSTANTGALVDTVYTTLSNVVRNEVGHISHTVNEAHDGVVIDIGGANNITGGTFTLYGLIK